MDVRDVEKKKDFKKEPDRLRRRNPLRATEHKGIASSSRSLELPTDQSLLLCLTCPHGLSQASAADRSWPDDTRLHGRLH